MATHGKFVHDDEMDAVLRQIDEADECNIRTRSRRLLRSRNQSMPDLPDNFIARKLFSL